MAIRDILIVSTVLVLAILALRRPWIGVMNWTWLSIMNPHRYAWGFAYDAPLAAIAAISTLVGLLFTKERRTPFQGAPTAWLLLLTIWISLSWLLGYDPVGDYPQWNKVMKIYFMTFVALSLLYTKHHIVAFAWVTAGSLAALASKGGYFTIVTGGNNRVWGPPGSFIEDNNEFALATILAIPLLHFLQLQLKKGWRRHVMSTIMLLCAFSAIGSQSRGALLAIVAMGVVLWWRSTRKSQIALIILLALIMILPFMPETWWSRMDTIQDYQQDASAMGRINAWLVALEVAKHNFFGGGMSYQHDAYFLAYGTYETTVRAAHSIYLQMLGNHGYIGLFFFLMMWLTTYGTAGKLRKLAQGEKEATWVAQLGAMVQVSLVAYAVGGAFLSLSYFDLPYNMMVMVVLARKWIENKAWEIEPKISFFEYAGLTRKKQ